jgi:CheY-like chemotaxis protein
MEGDRMSDRVRVRVLAVDDNALNLKLLKVLLTQHGYDVVTAVDATSMLDAMATARPELILLDLQLPGTDGFEIARRLKADPATSSIPIVAVTAFAMVGDEDRALNAGCDAYVRKPIDIKTLPPLIASLLQRSPT